MNITRLDNDRYLVGAVVITRQADGTWAAIPPDRNDGYPNRPLFTVGSLAEALDMAAGAIELLRPVES